MQSKNKKPPTASEKRHIERIKQMACVICEASGPSECHEIQQGQWFTSMPLCPDCHRGSINGWHGQRRMWAIKKMDELDALNITIERLLDESIQNR
jgi:hypothetical protein